MANAVLLHWKEFGAKDAPSIRTAFEKEPYDGIETIIRYLENGRVCLASAGVGIDAFTNEEVMHHYEILSDGEYGWSSMLPYYVKTYNMRLPQAFERKVLQSRA